ncbi:MAG TPA: response regulator, partial [Bryobacteraceae bacterium]|nr:response regulator [Bryobacteraceae bacterium]
DYLASILDALPTPVAVLSENMTVAMANEAFWVALGASAETGLGRHIDELAGDPTAASTIRGALASETATAEFHRQAGGVAPTFTVRRLVGTNELVLTVAAAPPPAAYFASRETEQFRAAFLAQPEPQLIVDSAGTVLYLSRAASELGLETGRNVRDLFPTEPARGLTELDGAEYRHRLADGRECRFRVATRRLGGGALLMVLHDIAETVRLEEQQRFGERMDAVSRLAGGVSHELNNILTLISSYCHMALDQAGQHADPTADIESILKAAGDATQLGNQLIAIGRRHVVQEGPTDLNEVLLGLERTIRGICGDAVRVSLSTEARLPAITIDPRQLERAILAIVLHAREAIGDGGSVTIHTGLTGSRVTLEISDSRNWPDEAVTMRIFEPYAPWPTGKRHSGLELAVAWCILQQRGAEVTITRALGTTTVRIAFGAHPQAGLETLQGEAGERGRTAPAPEPQPHSTVLLVDDNAEIRRAIRHMLEREAYHVMDVGHPLQALRAIEQLSNPIDVLVSDVNMPDMNGRELAQRARELRPGLKVLMISGYADEEIILGELFDDGVMFLQKPFSPDRLLKTMRQLVQQPAVRQ